MGVHNACMYIMCTSCVLSKVMQCLEEQPSLNGLTINRGLNTVIYQSPSSPSHPPCSLPLPPIPPPSLPPSLALSLPSLYRLKWMDEEGQEQQFRLIKKVSARWYEFGLLLGADFNELDSWESQYRGDADMCWIRVIDNWLTRGGSRDYPATWEGLYSLLDDLEFGSVAVKLKKAVLGQV